MTSHLSVNRGPLIEFNLCTETVLDWRFCSDGHSGVNDQVTVVPGS